MQNLSAEMARMGVTNADIQKILNCSAKTVTNKLSNVTAFTIPEAFAIRNTFFPGFRLEYLFAQEPGPQSEAGIRDSA